MLEGFRDSLGGWRFMDVLGKPLLDLPDYLVDDLLTLRRSARIMQRQLDDAEAKRRAKQKGQNPYGY